MTITTATISAAPNLVSNTIIRWVGSRGNQMISRHGGVLRLQKNDSIRSN